MQKNKRLIAKIFNGEEVIMTIDSNMLSCEFGALDRGNLTDVVNWGIYANRGSISFIDNIGYFNNQNVNSSQIKNYIVKFYLAKNQETIIATFKIDNVDFEEETRRVDIQLIGKIIELQRKPSVSLVLGNKDIFTFYTASAKYLLGLDEELDESEEDTYPVKYPSYGLRLGENTNLIENTFIYCPYLPFGKAWDKITKICQATMCRVIEDENGDPIITGERPQRTPIVVNPKNIISISKSYFVKVANSSIDLTNRSAYDNKKAEDISKEFLVNYGDDGEPLSISGAGDYSFGEWVHIQDPITGINKESFRTADFSGRFRLPYKIFSIRSVRRKESLEVLNYADLKTSYYSKEDETPFSASAHIDNYDYLRLSDVFVFWQQTVSERRKVTSIGFSFNVNYFEDGTNETITKITDENEEDTVKIDSNDLIQTSSYYVNEEGMKELLGEHILNETSRRYANGRECFEIECLFNDYYDENGNKVFSKDDLSTHFKKYDLIIPYVMKKGQTVPLRVNEDGTPKQFRVIGISYSYDGFLKQKLSVQEERYDID